jgi:hypothetical protein
MPSAELARPGADRLRLDYLSLLAFMLEGHNRAKSSEVSTANALIAPNVDNSLWRE